MNQKTIGIITYKVPNLPPWDPETIRTGITGSEEAVIYVSQHLAKQGWKVIVFADPPKDSIYSCIDANPRFVDLDFFSTDLLDVAISWRMPHIGKQLRRFARKVYFWPEDTIDRRVSVDMVDAFDDVLWISKYQREQWMSITPEFARFTSIFGNAINPEEFSQAAERDNPYSCIYGSNYARGLEILLDIWPALIRHYPRATLDIYYGWQHWGCLAREKEAKMKRILPNLRNVQEHGLVGHAELNRAYSNASFWTYPCIMPETFCTTAIRAQMGGAIPVIIDGSALKETVRHGYRCAKPQDYLATLLKAMSQAESISLTDRRKMKQFVLQEYTWEKIAARWSALFYNHELKPLKQ
jgi:glycosyltransferase involved in cell wall biosynthesis